MKSLNQQQFLDWADRYLRHELTAEDRQRFEDFCRENPDADQLFKEHKEFVHTFNRVDARSGFKRILRDTATVYHLENPKKTVKIISFLDKIRIHVAMAAAVAVVSVFSTLWLTGYYSTLKKATSDYSALRREVNSVKRNVNAQSAVLKNINNAVATQEQEAAHYGATGFLTGTEGYVLTNYHVVRGADSVKLRNHRGQSFRADIIFTDPGKDLAVLRINDTAFRALKNVPYAFRKSDADLGEDVYTIGFPRDEAVYGQGYLSSATGYSGDTLAYQISIPVNPGNSGGPVLDRNGNVIGMISGKQKGIDGAAFAIKTKALLETLNSIPTDSLPGDVVASQRNSLSGLPRTEQIKKLQDYVYLVKVYF